jgi:hypothetical protein
MAVERKVRLIAMGSGRRQGGGRRRWCCGRYDFKHKCFQPVDNSGIHLRGENHMRVARCRFDYATLAWVNGFIRAGTLIQFCR